MVPNSDVEQVNKLLKLALSNDGSQRQQAEAVINDISTKENFSSCLIAAIKHPESEESVKWLAAVQLKNMVNKKWNSSRSGKPGPNTFTEQEKQQLRSEVLHVLGMKDSKAALQVALAIARMARQDYPATWPTLLDELISPVTKDGTSDVLVRRIWLTLHHVIKQLATKRLPPDKRNFQTMSSTLLPFVWNAWTVHSKAIQEQLPTALMGSRVASLPHHFEVWMLTTKVLRRLIMVGISRDSETLQPNAELCTALSMTTFMFDFLLKHRPERPQASDHCHAMLEGALLKLTKLHCTVADVHPWSLESAGALIPCLQLCCNVAEHQTACGASWQPIVARSLRFVDIVLRSPHYSFEEQGVSLKPQAGSMDAAVEQWKGMAAVVRDKLEAFWKGSEQRSKSLAAALISLHLPVSLNDLADWDDDPEAWFHANEAVLLEHELRGISEIVLRTLVDEDPSGLVPQVLSALQAARVTPTHHQLVMVPQPPEVRDAMRRKEAAYLSACVLDSLKGALDVGEWLQGSLLPELKLRTPCTALLQRRCMHCMRSWVSDIKPEWRQAVYTAILDTLVAPSSDICLRLTAIHTLRTFVDSMEFDENQFLPFLQPLLAYIPTLMSQLTTDDSYVLVFGLVSSVVERLGDLVHPHAASILSWLPQVWQDSEGQGMLRMQILAVLQRLTNALGPSCVAMSNFVLPVLEYALNIEGPEVVTLIEDALSLWLVTLRNLPGNSHDALKLWPRWVEIMSTNIEHVPVCTMIASSCILLGKTEFLQAYGESLSAVLAHVIGDLASVAMISLFNPMHYLIQIFGGSAVRLLLQPLTKLLHLLLAGEEEVLAWVKGVTVFARVLVHCPEEAQQLFAHAAANGVRLIGPGATVASTPPAASGDQLLADFIGTVADSFDRIAHPGDRKLCAMGLARALTLPVPNVLGHFELIACQITGVWNALESGGSTVDPTLFVGGPAAELLIDDLDVPVCMSEDAQGETERRQAVTEQDPLVKVNLQVWTKESLDQALLLHGQVLQTCIAGLPGHLMDSLKEMVEKPA